MLIGHQLEEWRLKKEIAWSNYWNMDEKGILMGLASSQTFCVPRSLKEAKIMQGMLLQLWKYIQITNLF
jgi:hypothetical protein